MQVHAEDGKLFQFTLLGVIIRDMALLWYACYNVHSQIL